MRDKIKVSLIASSVRPQLYEDFFKSLKGTSVEYEVVFVGNIDLRNPALKEQIECEVYCEYSKETIYFGNHWKYIRTKNIKPAQCYEIARRNAVGETIVWVADDCEFPNDVIGKAYTYWKASKNNKLILSIQTKESGYNLPQGQFFDMTKHRLHAYKMETPLMAPLGMMSRKFLDELGGFDKRFVCGQYENQVVVRAMKKGGYVVIFGGEKCYVDIDHLGKSLRISESVNEKDFLNRPFAKGYQKDREILMLEDFQPYEDKDILTKSQSHKGVWD